MKQVLVILLLLSPLNVRAQKFLKPITIGLCRYDEFQDSKALTDKVTKTFISTMDSLSKKYEFVFITDKSSIQNKQIDLAVEINLDYNGSKNTSLGNLFNYKSVFLFTDLKTDSLVAKVELIYKDLENISETALRSDDYKTFDKVFSKIAIPVRFLLSPANQKTKELGLCLTVEEIIKPQNKSNLKIATDLTHILNNALVYHQKQYGLLYYDNYKTAHKLKYTSQSCSVITGSLEVIGKKYILKIKYGNTMLNPKYPRQVRTEFYLDIDRISNGDYYEATWQINKSVYSFLENNVKGQ
jgi:hypothetical protein